MLSGAFSQMGGMLFATLPASTNAVEAYNRISKSSTPGPLNVAMLMTYKEDMLAALEHLARLRGISTTYLENLDVHLSNVIGQLLDSNALRVLWISIYRVHVFGDFGTNLGAVT